MATNSYVPTHWEDAGSTASPLNAANLNHIEDGVAAATEAVQALEETMPEEAEDLSFGLEDEGYVTPDMVYQIINDVLAGGDLRIVNNRLKFTDLYDDTVYDLGGVTA